jgi:Ca2+-binding EF-hand superfamily protein
MFDRNRQGFVSDQDLHSILASSFGDQLDREEITEIINEVNLRLSTEGV